MKKLEYLALTTVILIFSWQNMATVEATSTDKQDLKIKLALANEYLIAQQQSKNKNTPQTEEDMIKALQERDKKIEGFKDMLKIDGVVPEVNSEGKNSIDTGDETMDALQKRQNKIKNLKELKQAQDLFNQTKLKDLQQENINLKNTAELEKLKNIVNDQNLDNEEIIKTLQKQNININSIDKLNKVKQIINAAQPLKIESPEEKKLSPQTAFKMLAIGIPATIAVFLVAIPFSKGIFASIKENYDRKFGKPTIPDRSLKLHNDAFQEISLIGNKAEKINDDKFGNEEFKALIHFKIDLAKGGEGFKELNYRVELLKAAIVAQKSFLKIESTELRYRGRKQQEFYRYVAENLEGEIDKEDFAKKIKKKQVEMLPLINTEEGREALNSYTKELNEISKYELGLKLLSLFKKYDLQDFSVIREVSNIVEGLKGADLLEPKNLILTAKEYIDVFEKIAPILELSKTETSATTYARILQVIGLNNRYGDSFRKFRELVRLLRKWENLYETVTMVREQYSDSEYKLPPEFKQDIPGESTYKQYAKYLQDLP